MYTRVCPFNFIINYSRTVDDHYDDYLDFTTGFSNDTDDRPKSSPSTKKAGPKHLSHIETDYGITDDVVVIGEKKYYYFKIPHKVCRHNVIFSAFYIMIINCLTFFYSAADFAIYHDLSSLFLPFLSPSLSLEWQSV